nr:movement protein p7A [Tolivirales sp.]WRQ65664.1 movement protein 1 (P7A protein) [Tolivirales sp.]
MNSNDKSDTDVKNYPTNRRGREYYSDREGGREKHGKGSLGRKVASDAISNSTGSTMGASVYIADTITTTINFVF